MEIRNVSEIGSDRRNILAWSRVDQIEVVSKSDPATARDIEDLVFDVAVEHDICDGRGKLRGSQGNRVKGPWDFVSEIHKTRLARDCRGRRPSDSCPCYDGRS